MYWCVQNKHFYINSFIEPFGCCVRKIHIPLSDAIYESKETWAYCALALHVLPTLTHHRKSESILFSPYASSLFTDVAWTVLHPKSMPWRRTLTVFFQIRCLCVENYLLSVLPDPRFPEKRCLGFMSRITLSPSPFLAWWLRSFCAFLAIFFTFATICSKKIRVKHLWTSSPARK